MNALSCPSRFDWAIQEDDNISQDTAGHSLRLHYFIERSTSRLIPSATHLQGVRRNLESREIATCDISDLVRQLYSKWSENTIKLEWSTYNEIPPITISDECYSDVGFLTSNIVFSPVVLDKLLALSHVDEAWFNERADRWEKEAGIHSSPAARFAQRDYVTILAKGVQVAPFILKRLRTSKRDWCWALERIFDPEDPGKGINNYIGKVNAWLEWGKEHNLI